MLTISGNLTLANLEQMTSNLLDSPAKVINFNPSDASIRQSVYLTMSWNPGVGSPAESFDVYIGTSSNPPLANSSYAATNYTSGTLAYSQSYYWKVNPKNSVGTTTGDILSFTTLVPVSASMFTDFESGSHGTLVTNALLSNTTINSLGTWTTSSLNVITVSTESYQRLSCPVKINGVIYEDLTGSRTIKSSNEITQSYVNLALTSPVDTATLGCMMVFNSNNTGPGQYLALDLISLIGEFDGSSHFVVCQLAGNQNVICHTENGGTSTDASQDNGITITLGQPYWVNVKYVKGGSGSVGLFNISTGAQIGLTQSLAIGNTQLGNISIGRIDTHGIGPTGSYTYYDNVVIDTRGTWPLGPF